MQLAGSSPLLRWASKSPFMSDTRPLVAGLIGSARCASTLDSSPCDQLQCRKKSDEDAVFFIN